MLTIIELASNALRLMRHSDDRRRRRQRNELSEEADDGAEYYRKRTKPADAPIGNFSNYYAIRKDVRQANGESDVRIGAIADWLKDHARIDGIGRRKVKRMLDVGCNSGLLTLQLASVLDDGPDCIVGVDVDEKLIARAQSAAFDAGWLKPRGKGQVGAASELRYRHAIGSAKAQRTTWESPRKRLDFSQRKIACFWARDWVFCDQGVEEIATQSMSDEQYRALQLGRSVHTQDQQGYDMIMALSVTKWIHLAHSDSGLRRFFARIAVTLRPGGVLILEPQPHKSYKSLHKVTKPDSQERRNLNSMRVHPDDFAWILTEELGFRGPYIVRDRNTDAGFMRDIHAYLQPLVPVSSACNDRRAQLLSRSRSDILLEDSIPWVARSR